MLDLSRNDPPLDLRERIERYKEANSPAIFREQEVLVISGLLRKNNPLKNYILQEYPDDIYETRLVRLMKSLSEDISSILGGFYAGFTASNKFVLFYHPSLMEFPINRDNLLSLVISRAVNYASKHYSDPMCLISAYQIPKFEVQNVMAYYKMSWIARRNRLLGEQYLKINRFNTEFKHDKILEMVLSKNPGKTLDSLLTPTLINGYFFSPFTPDSDNLVFN